MSGLGARIVAATLALVATSRGHAQGPPTPEPGTPSVPASAVLDIPVGSPADGPTPAPTSPAPGVCPSCGRAHDSGSGKSPLFKAFFCIGQPDQVVPPPNGWTLIVPPLPPAPPPPGETPKPAPPQPWKPLFYDNDFRYLDKPDNTDRNPADFLKRWKTPERDVVSDFGGEFRWQARVDDNRRLTGEQNNFNLFRERLYLNTWFYERFRTYWEVQWADASRQIVPPVFFDLNHGDVLNAFGEYRMARVEDDDGWWSVRYGWRQELLFGNQRLVSPLDWANSRRTFDYVPNLLYRGKSWNFDLFWGRPNQILARQLDQAIYSRQFFGTYITYKGAPNRLYDLYYLGLLQNETALAFNGEAGAAQVHTLGLRWQGEQDDWLWEGEAAYQFGDHSDPGRRVPVPRNAGALAAGFGRRFAEMPFRPELWFYHDYASGNRSPGAGSYATFNQLFPLAHKYFGYMDLVGRQNILDPNVNLKLYFGKRANLLIWYHNFHLASARAPLFNAAGAPIRSDPTGAAGRYVGDEIDVALNLILSPNHEWQFGLGYFFAGPFVQATAPDAAQARDGNFVYTQYTVRF